MGTALIVRSRAGLRLTEAGEALLRHCQTREHLEQDLLTRIRSGGKKEELRGVVRIGGFSSVIRSVVLPALAPLLCAHPRLQLKLVTRELYELKPLLRSAEIDFMVMGETLRQERLVNHLLGYEKNVLVQKRGYRGPEIYLDHDEEDMTTARFLKRRAATGFERRYLDDIYGILDGVRLGLGKAVVPLHLASTLPDLEVLNPQKVLSIPVVLHYYEQPFYPALHRAVVQTLTQNCTRLLR